MRIVNPPEGVLDKFKELEGANIEVGMLRELNEELGKDNEKLAGKLEKATERIKKFANAKAHMKVLQSANEVFAKKQIGFETTIKELREKLVTTVKESNAKIAALKKKA